MIQPIVTDIEQLRVKSGLVISTPYMLEKLIKDLRDTMVDKGGVGLSAIQIGVPLRVAVIRIDHGVLPLINPKIVSMSSKMETEIEGCLSIPDKLVPVERYAGVDMRSRTLKGKSGILRFKGLTARVVQHEIDHMDGKLIIDYL